MGGHVILRMGCSGDSDGKLHCRSSRVVRVVWMLCSCRLSQATEPLKRPDVCHLESSTDVPWKEMG